MAAAVATRASGVIPVTNPISPTTAKTNPTSLRETRRAGVFRFLRRAPDERFEDHPVRRALCRPEREDQSLSSQ